MYLTNPSLLYSNVDYTTFFLVFGIPSIGALLIGWLVFKWLLKSANKYRWAISILSFIGALLVLYVLVIVIIVLLGGL